MEEYARALNRQIRQVYARHPHLSDHRKRFPWLTGYLGNQSARIWFVAENPSLRTVERSIAAECDPITEETQWRLSLGDRLFRRMLVKYGFKTGSCYSPGGWKCYITDVIKQADYADGSEARSQARRNKVAEIWWPVLEWELAHSQPRLVVAMGRRVRRLLVHLQQVAGLVLPPTKTIEHYSYIAFRARGKQGPMHPARVKKYDQEFAGLARNMRRTRARAGA